MKSTLIKLLAVMMVACMLLCALSGCAHNCEKSGHKWDEGKVTVEPSCAVEGSKLFTCTVCGETKTEAIAKADHNFVDGVCTVCGAGYNGYLEELADYAAYVVADLKNVKDSIGSVDNGGTIDAAVQKAYEDGEKAINAALNLKGVEEAYTAAKNAIAVCIPLANGVYNYTHLSAAEKTKILGILENYGVRNGITGTTLYENGGYTMFSDRVTLGTENYIPGYGFGTLAEGHLTGEMATENNPAWKMYYHIIEAEDPGTANYLNSQDSTTGDFYGYFGASAYTNFMNATKDGYDWIPELAAADPEPLNFNEETKQASRWRFEIRKGLKYSTLGKYTAYNGRDVALEDYVTPFKLLFNQANAYYRGSEAASATGAASIVGTASYYGATKAARKGILSDEEADFSGVAIKAYEENGKWYFEYELGAPVTLYYSKYYISSTLYMPIPKEFVEEVGVDNYCGFSSDKTTTPVDNSLSLGAYMLERWDSDQQVVYKKNPNYAFASTKYAMEGLHINILTAAATDKEAGIKEFLAGKTDASSIPDTYLKQYRSDPRTRKSTGDSCFKLNFNALDAETWELYFGENGTVSQTSKDKYWQVEPAMNNAHFRTGLSYAIDRLSLADIKGRIASVHYLSSNYMSDPENGISYQITEAHKNAIAQLLDGTDEGGFSMELARDYFRMALDELEASGAYKPGTKENPTVIELEVAWQYPTHEEGYHKYIKQNWEDAFNDESVSGGKYKLDVKFWVGDIWQDVYNKKMQIGQFDVGFGSISGNPLNPLAFMNVLSTDQAISGGFTLNWGIDTNNPLADILVYDGMRWSFDALYKAANELAIVENGVNKAPIAMGDKDFQKTAESTTAKLTVTWAEGVTCSVDDFVIFGYTAEGDYNEYSIKKYIQGEAVVDETNRTITYTLVIPVAEYSWMLTGESQGVDVYWSYGIPSADVSIPSGFGGTYSFEFN